eukprot:14858-Heterococcus_DN1.PRE.2
MGLSRVRTAACAAADSVKRFQPQWRMLLVAVAAGGVLAGRTKELSAAAAVVVDGDAQIRVTLEADVVLQHSFAGKLADGARYSGVHAVAV